MQERSKCSPYQREFIPPYPLLPCSSAKKVSDMQHNANLYLSISSANPCEDRTRSHLFPAVADVSKIPLYVIIPVIAVVCVHILQKSSQHTKTTKVRCPAICQPLFFFLWCGRSRSKARSLHVKKQFEINSTLTPVVM